MRRLTPLVLCLALAGCKPDAPEDTAASASAAPSAAPSAAAFGPATLAMLLDEPEGLRFVRLDPDRAKDQREETLAKLPAVHGAAHVAWAPGRDEAIVWRGKSYDDPPLPEGLWQVTWGAAPSVTPLKGPGGGQLDDVGYDPQGRPTALVLQQDEPYKEPKKDAKGEFLTFEGKRYDVPAGQEGLKVLAHAFTWEGGAWKRTETIQTTTGWDYGLGVKALKAGETLYARTNAILADQVELSEVQDAKRLAALKPLTPKPADDGAWMLLAGDPPLWGWTVSGEFVHLTNRIMADVAGKPQALGGLDAPGDQEGGIAPGLRDVAAMRRGPLLLVSDRYVGGHPRLVDLATRDVKFASDRASAAVYWPTR